jgi:hypothetical protein
MRWLPGPETRAAVARHPFVLAGAAVVALLALVAGILVIIDSARGADANEPQVGIEPRTTDTPGPTRKTAVALGVSATTNTTTAVRYAPGDRTAVLGTIPRGTDVQIDGRTEDSGWMRIIFPPNSELHGWVDARYLDITGDVDALAVATAEPPPFIEVPTEPVSEFTPDPSELTPLPETTPTPLPGPPDLVVGGAPSVIDGHLYVTIFNQGTGVASGNLVVAVFNADQSALLGGTTIFGATIEPGGALDVDTTLAINGNGTFVIVVDPNGEIEETDNTNNRITVSIVTDPPTPVPVETPTIAPPPPPPPQETPPL